MSVFLHLRLPWGRIPYGYLEASISPSVASLRSAPSILSSWRSVPILHLWLPWGLYPSIFGYLEISITPLSATLRLVSLHLCLLWSQYPSIVVYSIFLYLEVIIPPIAFLATLRLLSLHFVIWVSIFILPTSTIITLLFPIFEFSSPLASIFLKWRYFLFLLSFSETYFSVLSYWLPIYISQFIKILLTFKAVHVLPDLLEMYNYFHKLLIPFFWHLHFLFRCCPRA